MNNKKVLLTTPDYPPNRIGGISTFVINLEQILKKMNINYELFVWNNHSEIKEKDFSHYDLILNAHFVPAIYKNHSQMINFIHGGELLPYSKNIFKRLYKKINHKNILNSLYKAKYNVFVSEFSFNLFKNYTNSALYDRDIVAHNCIDISQAELLIKNWNEKLKITCFVRDVPHKNVNGVLKLFKKIKEAHAPGAELHITAEVNDTDKDIINISGIDDSSREAMYRSAHLNILLSLDHSKIGNVEGFGLTVLEAGKYGVPTIGLAIGGLIESIHHKKTGWLFNDNHFESFEESLSFFKTNYETIQKNTFEHTTKDHSLDVYQRLLEVLI
jgi:glycosyltransferase involved in cell wall biosynthesis